MIHELIQRDGIIGLVFCQNFIDPDVIWEKAKFGSSSTLRSSYGMDGLVPHIEHIANLAGGSSANVAIGTDMDGGFGAELTPVDVDTIADLQSFPAVLRKAGVSDPDIDGILHGNALSFFRQAWS